jgi:signal transduction histidine kinase
MLMQHTGGTLDGKAHELKRKVYRSLERGEQLIEDLLALSIIKNTPEFSPVGLNKILDEVIEALEVPILEKNAIVQIGELPHVTGVPSYLVQLFSNLLSNALKFTNGTPVVRIAAAQRNGFAVVSVRDNGIGMEAEYFDKIFQVFQRLHPAEYEGTGIGLAICKKIAEVHGGKIEVESTVGEGTTFYVWLPLASA